MKSLRYVILGAGSIAGWHVNSYNSQPDVKPAGFLDIDRPTLQRWKERFPEAEVDTDVNRLLAKTRPDFAAVCTPNHVHCRLVKAALAAGCHVMCEKPMAMTLAEAQDMEKARIKAGRRGAINFSYRNVTTFRFAREVIASGELGEIHRVNVRYLQSFLLAAPHYVWRNDIRKAGFGAMGDLGVHMLDGASYVTGLEPARIIGSMQTLIPSKPDPVTGKPCKVTTDTNANFLIEYGNGAVGTFETSQTIPGYGNFFHIEVSGAKGLLRICSEDNDNITLLTSPTAVRYHTWRAESFPKLAVPTGFADKQPKTTMETFVKAIRGEKVKHATFADGVAAQRCLTAIAESIRRKAWTKV